MADSNVAPLKTDKNVNGKLFYNNLTPRFFTSFILQPTRLHSNTLIDNIFLTYLENQSTSDNLLTEISDHLIKFLILEGFVKERKLAELNLYKRNMSHFNERELKWNHQR